MHYLTFSHKMSVVIVTVGLISVKALGQVAPLSVTKSGVTDRGIEFVLRNNSEKPVTGFCVRTHSTGVTFTEFLPPHQALLPRATYTATISLSGTPPAEAEQEARTLVLTCVVSSDGVAGTVSEDVSSMAQTLAGTAFQAARLRRFLDSIVDSSNDRFPLAVQDAISRISALDITLDDGSKAQGLFASGMRNASALLLSRLKQLAMMGADGSNNISDLRSELSTIQREHRNLLDIASGGRRIRP